MADSTLLNIAVLVLVLWLVYRLLQCLRKPSKWEKNRAWIHGASGIRLPEDEDVFWVCFDEWKGYFDRHQEYVDLGSANSDCTFAIGMLYFEQLPDSSIAEALSILRPAIEMLNQRRESVQPACACSSCSWYRDNPALLPPRRMNADSSS